MLNILQCFRNLIRILFLIIAFSVLSISRIISWIIYCTRIEKFEDLNFVQIVYERLNIHRIIVNPRYAKCAEINITLLHLPLKDRAVVNKGQVNFGVY